MIDLQHWYSLSVIKQKTADQGKFYVELYDCRQLIEEHLTEATRTKYLLITVSGIMRALTNLLIDASTASIRNLDQF